MGKRHQGKKFSVAGNREELFVYGTLKNHRHLFTILGRIPYRRPAQLAGYRRVMLWQNGCRYPDLKKSSHDRVTGFLLKVNAAELILLDNYEGDPYHRTKVTLQNGSVAWVYFSKEKHPSSR